MMVDSLLRIFQRAVGTSLTVPLLSLPTLLMGCSSSCSSQPPNSDVRNLAATRGDLGAHSVPANDEEESPFQTPDCTADQELTVSNLKPEVPVEYIELRGDSDAILSQWGTLCGFSADPDGCRHRIVCPKEHAFLIVRPLAEVSAQTRYLVATRGSTVEVIDTLPRLRHFLGEIDTFQEAALLAWAAGYHNGCRPYSPGPGIIHRIPTGYELLVTRGVMSGCGGKHGYLCSVEVTTEGAIIERSSKIISNGNAICGRRPPGFRKNQRLSSASLLGTYLAGAAELEAASIPAFLILADELRQHAAPPQLIFQALASAQEEVDHTCLTAELARVHGGTVKAPTIPTVSVRSLSEVAEENANEGCVREMMGALTALWQASHAADPQIAAAMACIAQDELRHAALGWQIHTWARQQLNRNDRHELREAMKRAVIALQIELRNEPDAELITKVGLPHADESLQWLQSLEQELWRA